MSIKLLDCTFRDGGYYTDWIFPEKTIADYARAVEDTVLDHIELGFRTLSAKDYKGDLFYTPASIAQKYFHNSEKSIGFMINASELIKFSNDYEAAASAFVQESDLGVFSLVRIAAHVKELPFAIKCARSIKEKGFTTGLNIMQIAEYEKTEIKETLRADAVDYNALDVIYFADSMGSLLPSDVEMLTSLFLTELDSEIGFHAHDNRGFALINSLTAYQAGASWIDSTITGMGRGPGNTKTEDVLLELGGDQASFSGMQKLLELIDDYFLPLKAKYGWGDSPYYRYSGQNSIHPSYVQEFRTDLGMNVRESLTALDGIRGPSSNKFVSGLGSKLLLAAPDKDIDSKKPQSVFKGKDVLILGGGGTVAERGDAIKKFIESLDVIILHLNFPRLDLSSDAQYVVVAHPLRNELASGSMPLITSNAKLFERAQVQGLSSDSLFYPMHYSDRFKVYPDRVETPYFLGVELAICLGEIGGADNIYLAGIDGFEGEDSRNKELNALFKDLETNKILENVVSITPSRLNLKATNPYELRLK